MLSDSTMVGPHKWSFVRTLAMKDNYFETDFYSRLSEADRDLLEKLRTAQRLSGGMQPLKYQSYGAIPQGQPVSEPMKAQVDGGIPQDLDNSFENWSGDTLKTCDDLIYLLTLNNATEQKIAYKVKFRVTNPTEVPNLRWPLNGVRGTLAANSNENVALLQKIVPTEGVSGE